MRKRLKVKFGRNALPHQRYHGRSSDIGYMLGTVVYNGVHET